MQDVLFAFNLIFTVGFGYRVFQWWEQYVMVSASQL